MYQGDSDRLQSWQCTPYIFQVGLTRAEHAQLVKRELKRNPWKYTVRQVSTYELLAVSMMIILPSLIYSYMLLKLPESKYRVPLSQHRETLQHWVLHWLFIGRLISHLAQGYVIPTFQISTSYQLYFLCRKKIAMHTYIYHIKYVFCLLF